MSLTMGWRALFQSVKHEANAYVTVVTRNGMSWEHAEVLHVQDDQFVDLSVQSGASRKRVRIALDAIEAVVFDGLAE